MDRPKTDQEWRDAYDRDPQASSRFRCFFMTKRLLGRSVVVAPGHDALDMKVSKPVEPVWANTVPAAITKVPCGFYCDTLPDGVEPSTQETSRTLALRGSTLFAKINPNTIPASCNKVLTTQVVNIRGTIIQADLPHAQFYDRFETMPCKRTC